MYLDEEVAPEFYGQATQDGTYDDVETYGPDGGVQTTVNGSAHLAWLFIVLALGGLWLMGAGLFKGSNHS